MPIVFGAIAAAGAIGSFISSMMGGGAKRDAMYAGASLTDKQAEFTQQQTDEQARRATLEADQRGGAAQAAAGASGFASMYGGGSTLNKYATALQKELNTEVQWTRYAGFMTSYFQHQAANIQRQSADAGLWGDALSASAWSPGEDWADWADDVWVRWGWRWAVGTTKSRGWRTARLEGRQGHEAP